MFHLREGLYLSWPVRESSQESSKNFKKNNFVTSVWEIKQPCSSADCCVLRTTAISVEKLLMLWRAPSRRFQVFGAGSSAFMRCVWYKTPTVYWWVGKSNLNTVWGWSLQNKQQRISILGGRMLNFSTYKGVSLTSVHQQEITAYNPTSLLLI